jgi:RNA ligase (TIGR02306 family)
MRKMATIRKIDRLEPIEGADRIETAVIDGWKVVVKKGEFKVGDKITYCEIDSWIPNSVAPFLTKPDRFPKEYLGVPGEKLKTVKLKGQISQGLVLPFNEGEVGDDVSELLGIVKWEAPVSAQLGGQARGSFPSEIPKTDQERIQNIKTEFYQWRGNPFFSWEVTEKLEGSSCTFYLDFDGVFHVCSRNIDIKEDMDNTFWKLAYKYCAKEFFETNNLLGKAIQGEAIGPGIQGNIYQLKEVDLRVFDVYDVKAGKYMIPEERMKVIGTHFQHEPVIHRKMIISGDLDKMLLIANGVSLLNDVRREGLVYKCNEKPFSFKTISNDYLINGAKL